MTIEKKKNNLRTIISADEKHFGLMPDVAKTRRKEETYTWLLQTLKMHLTLKGYSVVNGGCWNWEREYHTN